MEVTIDKFDRILILNKIRKLLGLSPGQTLEFIPHKDNRKLAIKAPIWTENLDIEYRASGLPVIQAGSMVTEHFATILFIKQTRDDYLDGKAGLE